MIRIRKIINPYLESNLRQIEKVKEIVRTQFPGISTRKVDDLVAQLTDPVKFQYQSMLFVAEDNQEAVRGFAALIYMADLNFCFLDYLAVSPEKGSSGLGGALYNRVREEAEAYGVIGIFFECLPDDPVHCGNKELIAQNRKRLGFYERFGARPIMNTGYASPVTPEDNCPPYLVFDGLGARDTIPNDLARGIVRVVLERKYPDYCPESYIANVVDSIMDDPVILRPPRYSGKKESTVFNSVITNRKRIFMVVNDQHIIHHVRERGYVEAPVRVEKIKKELDKTGFFRYGTVREYADRFILDVHDTNYFNYFKKVCESLPAGKSVYPYVFPLRNVARAPVELSVRAGYYCFDTFTPLNKNAFLAARWGVNCTLTATDGILSGDLIGYVLTRPPGHHAERSVFGGFCYFNNCAIAANYLSRIGKVAILDIDFHHGNGQQQIFYQREDVLTLSIHGHPSFAYPYFSGFTEEKGEGRGVGYNVNFPLPEKTTYESYKKSLDKALRLINDYKPEFLIVALGLDTAKGDPTGTWSFNRDDFQTTGKLIGSLRIPTLVIQEGGYHHQSLGANARAFFTGLSS